VSLTVGTAGHIDHGKTAIVKWLTGCDCDRLPEEKARGMTIDLGFAACQLPDDRRIGIVDVPGHERFIHNMVAGAAGIDVVMLVVAADDGVMPQTREHMHIVRLLGIRRGLVVINKMDLADEARRQDVREQVRELVRGSFLEDSPVVFFSARTGDGFDAFYDAFVATVNGTAEHDASGPFRLHVERAFVLQGLGTIVSGIPRSGAVRPGDELELLPAGTRHAVKGLQVYGADAAVGRAGECAALRLAGVTREGAVRGMVLAAPGYFHPSRFVNARFSYLPEHDRPLEPRTAIRLHIGTAEAPGHLVLPELARLPPGGESYVQLQLSRPVVASAGDFFVVRQLSPVRTLGGGYVIDCSESKIRRSRGDWVAQRQEKEVASHDPEQALALALESVASPPVRFEEWARLACVDAGHARPLVARLCEQGAVVSLSGDRYASRGSLESAVADLLARLNDLHDARPLELGFEKKEIFRDLHGPRPLVDLAFERLQAGGQLAADGPRFRLAGRAPRLSADEQALAGRLEALFREAGFATPRPDELPERLRLPRERIDPVLTHLLQTGALVTVSDKVILHREAIESSRAALEAYLRKAGRLPAGLFKDILGTTRKYSIPLLEYWDRMGLTRREGDDRVLREPRPGG
jgi:selenocysteine-specific elongation factor